MKESPLTALAARVAYLPLRLFLRRPFVPPRKALILKPCCLSQAMLTTPLLAALSEAYPRARFDWAASAYARPAIATNPRITELVDTGDVGLPGATWQDARALAERLRPLGYDTCFIPSRSSRLAAVAWMADIPQRVGLRAGGRGFAHTLAVSGPGAGAHAAEHYLSLVRPLGIEAQAQMEFYPADGDRTRMTELLVDEVEWLGDRPLVLMHPGGGENPWQAGADRRWPEERFALLGNYLARTYDARILLVGAADDRPLTQAMAGMISAPVVDLTGRTTLSQLGALCEMADLYVGNDTGPTHVAAAAGCATLAIFGPTDPARSGPYAGRGPAITLWHPSAAGPDFSWQEGVTVAEARAAADLLLKKPSPFLSNVY